MHCIDNWCGPVGEPVLKKRSSKVFFFKKKDQLQGLPGVSSWVDMVLIARTTNNQEESTLT